MKPIRRPVYACRGQLDESYNVGGVMACYGGFGLKFF